MSEAKTNVTINVDPVTGSTSVVGFDPADTKESYDLLKKNRFRKAEFGRFRGRG